MRDEVKSQTSGDETKSGVPEAPNAMTKWKGNAMRSDEAPLQVRGYKQLHDR